MISPRLTAHQFLLKHRKFNIASKFIVCLCILLYTRSSKLINAFVDMEIYVLSSMQQSFITMTKIELNGQIVIILV